MPLPIASWYCGSTKWSAVAAWAASTAYAAGTLLRQLSVPAVGSERVFVCVVAGTSGSSEPTWVVTKGAKTTDNTATWQEVTGQAGVNGDLVNQIKWAAIASAAIALGYTVQDAVGDTVFICTTAGTAGGTEPTWNKTAGTTTTDGSITWTSIGPSFGAWAAPHARIANASTSGWMAAGDTCFVSNNHAATQATSTTIPSSGTALLPIKFYCVSDTTAPSITLATGGSETCTGSNNITFNSYASFNGLTFNDGAGAANFTTSNIVFANDGGYYENCTFNSQSTYSGTSAGFVFAGSSVSSTASGAYFLNCKLTFGALGQVLNCGALGVATFVGGSIALTGTAPAVLLTVDSIANRYEAFYFRDVDLSGISGTLVNYGGSDGGFYTFVNCKLNASVVPTSGTPLGLSAPAVKMYNCDSAATNYKHYVRNFLGTQMQETTVVRSGGATDQTTPISWNITTGANNSYVYPYISEEIVRWNTLIGSARTATVYLTSNTLLNTNDIWLELEYPSSASTPLGATASSRAVPLSVLTQLTTDSSTWGGSTTSKYKLSTSFTAQMLGVLKARIFVAKQSSTVYVDPLLNIV